MISRSVADTILKMVAARYKVPHLVMRSASRVEPYVTARCEAMHVLRQFDMSYPEIGRLFANRDHTTVMAACKRVEERIASHVGYKAEVEAVIAEARSIVAGGGITGKPLLPTDAETQPEGAASKFPLLELLRVGRDECAQKAQDLHRLSMLLDSAIARVEGREQPITVAIDVPDEKVPG